MARVTVEDCILKIPNRFDLVLLAAERARSISAGAPLTVDRDNDKNPVVALREVADSSVDFDHLRQSLIGRLQKHVERDEPEEDMMELLASEQNVAGVPYDSKSDEVEDEMTVEGEGEGQGEGEGEETPEPSAENEA